MASSFDNTRVDPVSNIDIYAREINVLFNSIGNQLKYLTNLCEGSEDVRGRINIRFPTTNPSWNALDFSHGEDG